MGRRRSNRNRRDAFDIPNRRLPYDDDLTRLPSASRGPIGFRPFTTLQTIEDRREWNPEGDFRPARSFNQSRHRLTINPVARSTPPNRDRFARLRTLEGLRDGTLARVGFERPDRVMICVRRKIRREVMHALGHAGKGGQKPPKFNFYSKISCRR